MTPIVQCGIATQPARKEIRHLERFKESKTVQPRNLIPSLSRLTSSNKSVHIERESSMS